MSTNNKPDDDMMCCASCGIAEVDDIKLKECAVCDLVRYCSDKCEQEHWTQHKAMCKERAAELRDEILFRQPESSYLGDCPICFLPLPIDTTQFTLMTCCSKVICKGCVYAYELRKMEERLQQTCPFCRQPRPETEQVTANVMKRVQVNDPVAMFQMGVKHYNEGDYNTAFEYFTKAAELGNIEAQHDLSFMYWNGQGVEKDLTMGLYHLEEAAIAGHPKARYKLGILEGVIDRIDRAVKHLIIAANLGYDESIQALKKCYVHGDVSKEDFATALRAHQAAVDAIKSPQREAAAKAEAAGEIM